MTLWQSSEYQRRQRFTDRLICFKIKAPASVWVNSISFFFVSWREVYTSCLNILIWIIEKVNYENLTIRNYKKMRKRPPAPFLGRNLQNRHRKRSRRTNKQKQKNFYFRQTKEQSSLLSRKKSAQTIPFSFHWLVSHHKEAFFLSLPLSAFLFFLPLCFPFFSLFSSTLFYSTLHLSLRFLDCYSRCSPLATLLIELSTFHQFSTDTNVSNRLIPH